MASPTQALARTFSPLRFRDFRLYFIGQGVSLVGTFMQQMAAQWLVWQLSHDAAMQGVSTALFALPMLILVPVTSALADGTDRRRILIITQTVDMCLAFVLAVFVLAGLQVLWPVLVVMTLLGVSAAFTVPAQSAFIGDLSGIKEVRSAYTLYGMVIETARLIGPALAGWAVSRFGLELAFGLNGLSFVAVIISLLIIRAQASPRMTTRANPLVDFARSLRFMAGQPRLVDLMICRLAIMLFIFSSLTLFAPLADQVLGGDAALMGNLLSASGAGALIGAIFVGPQLQHLSRPGLGLTLTLVWSGVFLALTSLANSAFTAVAGVVLFSLNIPVVLTNVSALTQVLAPPEMRARLGGAQQMVASAVQPLGALLVGAMGAQLGPLLAMRVNGLLMLVVAAGLLASSAFRRWTLPTAAPHDGAKA